MSMTNWWNSSEVECTSEMRDRIKTKMKDPAEEIPIYILGEVNFNKILDVAAKAAIELVHEWTD